MKNFVKKDVQLMYKYLIFLTTIIFNESGIYRLKFPFGWQQENTWEDWLFSNEFTVQ